MKKRWYLLLSGFLFTPLILSVVLLTLFSIHQSYEDANNNNQNFTSELPIYSEVKGKGQISDEVARFAVGVGIKYHLLPSVVLSQYAFESSWGTSQSANNDKNNFGITWFSGSPFPKGTPRGHNGSEGGYYMSFPNQKTGFNYYGFMIYSQKNFNESVGKTSPSEVLLILGKGGYASSGITEESTYFKTCLSMIEKNEWVQMYDSFAIKRWNKEGNFPSTNGLINDFEKILGQKLGSGQCYAIPQKYVQDISGFRLKGLYAKNIASDNTTEFLSSGWTIINNPKASQLVKGAVINWQPGMVTNDIAGHTAVIYSVGRNGEFSTYEQNVAGNQFVQRQSRTWDSSIVSICIPPK
ncbi:MAG: glucosaminidase domain-containing protein [Streptococcaceae bacterium]|jgi:hypothetical protein|nr:glucosaminidase domain-containing protein [Streptococcaceae bacterium]